MKVNSPLYFQIAESIRELIVSGELAFGQQLPSQKKLSQQYNVSLITIKRAILELVREGLLYGRPGKGVFVGTPMIQADASRRNHARSVGAVITDLASPFYSSVLRAVEIESSRHGYFVIFSNTDDSVPNESQQIERLLNIGVSGFVVASRQHQNELQPHLVKLLNGGIPLVLVSYTADTRVNYVGTDHRQGGYLATRHLLSLGYSRIAYVCPDLKSGLGRFRYRGYVDALRDAGHADKDIIVISIEEQSGENRYRGGYRIGRKIVKKGNFPEAIFAFSDLAALGLKRAFLEKGVRVPQDIAIVGFDDIPMAEQSLVPLTTIRQPFEQIGQLAFDTLRRKMGGDTSITRLSLMPELVIRESCGAYLKRRPIQD